MRKEFAFVSEISKMQIRVFHVSGQFCLLLVGLSIESSRSQGAIGLTQRPYIACGAKGVYPDQGFRLCCV